ncbi:MAG TPA: response regulator [Mariprofundaceae bacterium]|nr:response regulator [Mariprofundaceae bacterium]
MNVLLIEDEENMQTIIAAFLKRFADKYALDIKVKALLDPIQGLFESTTNGSNYDLILLDVRLPKLSGDEIYRSIMHVNPEILDRILFVTGYKEDLLNRFADADLRILDKPFRYDQFEAHVSPLLA